MSETPTGTDRVELTDDEWDQLAEAAENETLGEVAPPRGGELELTVESIVAARVQALTAERDRLRVDTNINADEVERQRGLLDLARAELAALDRAGIREAERANKAQAELAAANARCAELEGEVDEWKSEADDQREAFVWANGACQEQATQKWAAIAERDALQATLDRVAALADELRNQLDAASAGLHARQSELEEVQRNLRAAEDRIERWKDVARASFTDRDSIPGDPQGGWRWKWRIPKMEPDFRVRISRLADNLSGFIPSDALGSPEERAAAAATSKHWERNLRVALSGPGTKDGDDDE